MDECGVQNRAELEVWLVYLRLFVNPASAKHEKARILNFRGRFLVARIDYLRDFGHKHLEVVASVRYLSCNMIFPWRAVAFFGHVRDLTCFCTNQPS